MRVLSVRIDGMAGGCVPAMCALRVPIVHRVLIPGVFLSVILFVSVVG